MKDVHVVSVLRRCGGMLLGVALSCCLCDPAAGESLICFDNPAAVLLSPRQAVVRVERSVPFTREQDQARIRLLLPQQARNLHIDIPGQTLIGQETRPLMVEGVESAREERRRALQAEKGALESQLAAVRARLSFWSAVPSQKGWSDEERLRYDRNMAEKIPALQAESQQLDKKLSRLEQALSVLPPAVQQVMEVSIFLRAPRENVQELPLRYSYVLPDCGWTPRYSFDARPEQGDVSVRLTAEIRQYSGMDWRNVDLTLAAQGSGAREPGHVRPWLVRADEPQARLKDGNAAEHEPMPLMLPRGERAVMAVAPASAGQETPVLVEQQGFMAIQLGRRTLPEGAAQMVLRHDQWKTPLRWLARPEQGESRVWLMVRHHLDNLAQWPAGPAFFSIDGNAVGEGSFAPHGDEVTLFFGVDPRLSVLTASDSRISGKSGILDRRRTWDWSWIFTVVNGRDTPVQVRLERPEVQPGDSAIHVSYTNTPEAVRDENHTLVWEVSVPAGGKSEVRHAVRVSAPQDMPVQPGR